MPTARHNFRNPHAGFTLTEVLLAVALMSLLLLAISQIFAITSKTIRIGANKSASLRTLSAIRAVINQDLQGSGFNESGIVPAREAPFMIISNMRVAAFADEEDEQSASTYRAQKSGFTQSAYPDSAVMEFARSRAIRTTDLNFDGAESAGEVMPIYAEGFRNHRVDTFSFFSRGRFQRQTGRFDLTGRDALVGTRLDVENAWIWYGHLKVAVGNPETLFRPEGYAAPGEHYSRAVVDRDGQFNRNNLYANQFVLGRVVTMMRQPQSVGSTLSVFDENNQPQWFAWPRSTDLSPLASGSPIVSVNADGDLRYINRPSLRADGTDVADAVTIEQGLVDLAGAGLGTMRGKVLARQGALLPWHEELFGSHNQRAGGGRFWFNPFPETLPSSVQGTATSAYSAAWSSEQSKVLAHRSPQFIVEFAGDFVTQDLNTSVVTAAEPDGRLDFALIGRVMHTKWYGMPRDIDLDGMVSAARATASLDVQPVRDMLVSATPTAQSLVANCSQLPDRTWRFHFEQRAPLHPPASTQSNYLTIIDEIRSGGGTDDTPADSSAYVCGFGPTQLDSKMYPRLIRITIDCASPRNTEAEPTRGVFTYSIR